MTTVTDLKRHVRDLDAQLRGQGPSARQWSDLLFLLDGVVEAPAIVAAGPPRQMTAEECRAHGANVVPFPDRRAA